MREMITKRIFCRNREKKKEKKKVGKSENVFATLSKGKWELSSFLRLLPFLLFPFGSFDYILPFWVLSFFYFTFFSSSNILIN